MIYLIGGAARVGKTTLCQQVSSTLNVGWVSTDLLMMLLGMTEVAGIKTGWNATPEALTTNAEWFYPYLERFVWSINLMAEQYVIEGVDFLPSQVSQLSPQYPIRAVFLGCSSMTLEVFDQFPGHSEGYSFLPEEKRRQIVQDIPPWSEFIRQEAERFGYPYVDMVNDFPQRLSEAETTLTSGSKPPEPT
jgi:hypothetical protein